MSDYEQSTLWKNAFTHCGDGMDNQRDILAQAYRDFRGRVDLLLQQIQRELPSLTPHGIAIIPVTRSIAERAVLLTEHHKDPVDRIIIANAIEYKSQLLSVDGRFPDYQELAGLLV